MMIESLMREEHMDQLIPLISDVGFPIIVTLYLLHRIEAKLDSVVQSIQSLPGNLKEKAWNDSASGL
jgi:YvrJ protein family